MAEMPEDGRGLILDRFALVITGLAVLTACIAATLPCGVLASNDSPEATRIGSRAPVFLARQDTAVDATDAASMDAGPEAQSESEADSKTTPAESDTLKEFTPSEEIEADQGVDFPYDI